MRSGFIFKNQDTLHYVHRNFVLINKSETFFIKFYTEKAIQLQQGRNFVLRFQMNIRVNIQMMDERTKKKNRGTYGKDVKNCTVECHDPWCHGKSDIKGVGVT